MNFALKSFLYFNSLNVSGRQTIHSIRENTVKQWEWGTELAEDYLKLGHNYLKKAIERECGACFCVRDEHPKKVVSDREELHEPRVNE